jgi:type IV pilus assembly protein PilB
MVVDNRDIDLRVSILPTLYGEKAVIRILDKSQAVIRIDDLGFLPRDLRLFKAFVTRPQGIILLTGPTGSGKTTTLYAAINMVKSDTKNIITVEDPIEYQMDGINQVQVNEKAGMTFATALRSVLRQDPNVIMVGEIRDQETAEIAFRASLTGHLVLTTLHTNDAPSAVTRLLDLNLSPYLIASSLIGVVAQRLVRKIHADCRESYQVDARMLRRFGLETQGDEPPTLSRGRGCAKCEYTGYRGRLGVFQILPMRGEIKELVATSAPLTSIITVARKAGMKTLFDDGLDKVLLGLTTLEEVMRVVEEGTGVEEEEILAEPEEFPSDSPVRILRRAADS